MKQATGDTGSQKFLFATLKTCIICVYSSKKILKPNRIEPTQFHNERLLNWVDPPKKELNRIGSFSLWITSCVWDRWGHYFTTSWVLGYCHGGHRAFRTEPCGSTVASLGTQQNCGWNDDNSNRSKTINYPISGHLGWWNIYLVGVAPPSISRPPGSLDGLQDFSKSSFATVLGGGPHTSYKSIWISISSSDISFQTLGPQRPRKATKRYFIFVIAVLFKGLRHLLFFATYCQCLSLWLTIYMIIICDVKRVVEGGLLPPTMFFSPYLLPFNQPITNFHWDLPV